MCTGKIFTNPAGCIDKVDSVIIVLFDTRSYSKNIRVKNNIMRIESYLINQQTVSPLTDFYFTGSSICLSFFVESHYHSSSTILFNNAGML